MYLCERSTMRKLHVFPHSLLQLKMHETMKNQSRWNWKTLNCAFQLQNNDNNNTQWQTLKGMHTRVLEVVKDKGKKTSESVIGGVESYSGRGGILKLTYRADCTLSLLFKTEFSHQCFPSNTFTPIHCIHKAAVCQ